jgi:hypothetical protein
MLLQGTIAAKVPILHNHIKIVPRLAMFASRVNVIGSYVVIKQRFDPAIVERQMQLNAPPCVLEAFLRLCVSACETETYRIVVGLKRMWLTRAFSVVVQVEEKTSGMQ